MQGETSVFWQCDRDRDLHSRMVEIFKVWIGVGVVWSLHMHKPSVDGYVNLQRVPYRSVNECQLDTMASLG